MNPIDENSREYKALKQLEDALNSTCWNHRKFADGIRTMHPYLQAIFFNTLKACLDHFADPEKRVDGRNEHCKNIAQSVLKATKDIW